MSKKHCVLTGIFCWGVVMSISRKRQEKNMKIDSGLVNHTICVVIQTMFINSLVQRIDFIFFFFKIY